jgi:hypothetical protein
LVATDLSSQPEESWAGGPPKVMKNVSARLRPSMELLPFPLSSGAKPRDLQFYGPFVEMFFDRAQFKPPWDAARFSPWLYTKRTNHGRILLPVQFTHLLQSRE